jgi:hypothetical protein
MVSPLAASPWNSESFPTLSHWPSPIRCSISATFERYGLCDIGFSLWGLVLAKPKPHRLKPMPRKARPRIAADEQTRWNQSHMH